jgi:hypothetical protein
MSADEIRQPLMGERQRDGDALRQNPPPPFRQVPEREQQPIVDSLMVSDRERDGERVSATRAAVEEFQSQLGPWIHPHDQVVVEYGQSCWLQHDPPDLRLDMRALLIPAPWPDHITGAQQFHATTSEYLDLPTDQPVDDQKPPMMRVELLGRRDVPIACTEVPYPRSRLSAGPVTVGRRHQILKLGISVDDADRIRGSAQAVCSSPRAGSQDGFSEELTSGRAYPSDPSASFGGRRSRRERRASGRTSLTVGAWNS